MLSNEQPAAFRRKLLRWYKTNGRDLPWRHTVDPYAILVSEVMLQQTQVAAVVPFYYRWLERFPTLRALAAAAEPDVLHAWQGLGYYSRARNLHSAAKIVVRDHGGTLPSDPDTLRKLPGIGRYTANAIATFAFNRSVPIVEANITRVIARVFDVDIPIESTAGREQLWQGAATLVAKKDAGRFNSALMDLGALVCVGRTPKCDICPVVKFCKADRPESRPVTRKRPKIVQLVESHMFVRRGNRLLLEQCADRWRGMWMLPSIANPTRAKTRALHSAVFPFTHHRVALRVYAGKQLSGRQIGKRWIPITQLDTIPMPSPHRRAVMALLGNHS